MARTFISGGKVSLGQVVLSKLLPLVIIIPLFFSIQTFFPALELTFDFEQGAYVLAIGIIVVVSAFEGRISQGGQKLPEGLNLGSGISYILMLAGIGFLIFILGFGYTFNDATINEYISWYLGISLLVVVIQTFRDIPIALKATSIKT